ncbi:MAG: sugar-binding protein [Verrucomicrobiota bacterium]
MNKVRAILRDGYARACLLVVLATASGAFVVIAAPQWWTDSGAVNSAIQDDYAVINQGQLKNIASKALEHIELKAPGTPNLTAIQALVNDWDVNPGNNDYAAVNAGQLKAVVAPFYDVLEDIGYHAQEGWQYTYPWDDPLAGSADDYALVNAGQVKQLFDFDVTNIDGLPTSIKQLIVEADPDDEITDFSHVSSGDDYDGDGIDNLTEYQEGTDPTDPLSSSAQLIVLKVFTPLED